MPQFAGNPNDQTVSESDSRPALEVVEGCAYDICVLQDQSVVFEEHCEGGRDAIGTHAVDRGKDPDCLRKYQMGNPRARGNEGLRPLDLTGVVTHQQSDQDAAVNGAHACAGGGSECPPSCPPRCGAQGV